MKINCKIHDGIAGGVITLGGSSGGPCQPTVVVASGHFRGHAVAKRIHRVLPGL